MDYAGDGGTLPTVSTPWDWDVKVGQTILGVPPYILSPLYQTQLSVGSGNISYPMMEGLGGKLLYWSTAIDGNYPHEALDTWAGGRSDPAAGTDLTRNLFEFGPAIGPPAPIGTNQNGNNNVNVCGLSTGSGTPGTCKWYVGAAGSSGAQVNGGGSVTNGSGRPGTPTFAMTLGPTGLDLASGLTFQVNGTPIGGGNANITGSGSISVVAPYTTVICTSTCNVTPLVPSTTVPIELCVLNEPGVSTVITMNAVASTAYPKADNSGFGTANTGTMVSNGANGNKVCLIGQDATHYALGAVDAISNWTVN
jgi:hypothetical protein